MPGFVGSQHFSFPNSSLVFVDGSVARESAHMPHIL
jgi:hypothetical protein